ncbi:MAG: DUF975 family protein [Prevotella sp.]|nr:DUF975 family protein [Prevotella sp.]
MGNNQTYKNRALKSLEGKWVEGIITTLFYLLIAGCVGSIISLPFGNDAKALGMGTQGIWALLCLPLGWGFAVYFLNLIRNQDISYGRLFDGYRDFGRIFLAGLLVGLCEAIGFLLLIVPGVIASLMFSQTCFIMKDDPQVSATDAMKRSMEMMDGHKWELFKIGFSFLGWIILAVLTCGFGFLFLYPYMYTTLAHYYEDLKGEKI